VCPLLRVCVQIKLSRQDLRLPVGHIQYHHILLLLPSATQSPPLLLFLRSVLQGRFLSFSSTFFRSSRTTSKYPGFDARCRAVKPYFLSVMPMNPRGGLTSRSMRTTAAFPAFAASAEYPPPPPRLRPVRNFTRSSFSALCPLYSACLEAFPAAKV
jgi:hypothetical protein